MSVITEEPVRDAPRVEPPPAQVRRGPRRRSPWPLALIVVAVVALVIGAGRLDLDDLLPSPPNPFAEKTVDRSPPAVLRALEDLSEYRAATGYFQVMVDLEEDAKYLPAFIRGERTLFVASGTVDAAVDFSTVADGAIEVSEDRRSVQVSLPAPHLTAPRVDPERSHVVSRDRGVLDRVGSVFSDSPTGERHLYLAAEKKLEAAARDGDIVRRAEENTRSMLDGMLRSLGFTEVKVHFSPPTG